MGIRTGRGELGTNFTRSKQEKEETDRIRAKAFKERGLTYSA